MASSAAKTQAAYPALKLSSDIAACLSDEQLMAALPGCKTWPLADLLSICVAEFDIDSVIESQYS